MELFCRNCQKKSRTVGFDQDNPVLACGCVHVPLTEEEEHEIISDLMNDHLEALMLEHGVEYDEALDLYLEMNSAQVAEYKPDPNYIPKSKPNPEFKKKPRWVVEPNQCFPKVYDLNVLVGIFGARIQA